jgi:hypothetical protein
MATLDTRSDRTSRRLRPSAALIAAVIGVGGGLAFGAPVPSMVESAWTGFLLPAYLALQQAGLPFCG